jgi:Protein of unknown function (DUF3313)
MRRDMRFLLLGFGFLALSACAARTESVERPPTGAVAGTLQPAEGERGAWTYLAPDVDLKKYTRFILEPPTVYRGEGASYPSNFSQQDREEIARYFVEEAKQVLEPEYPIVTEPGPDVARLRFTLIGVEQTVPYASTVTRLVPVGAAINMVSSAAGGGGTLTGSVTYAIEAFDSESGTVVAAAVRRLTPGAFDLSSTLGTKETARAVARDAAVKLRARLDSLHAS